MPAIQLKQNQDFGHFLNKYFYNRCVENNQNVIIAFSGATGSGKTYCALSQAESWYRFKFKHRFNHLNICFNLGDLMIRINDLREIKKLRKGELFILEEAGTNFGNLDFQNKLSKMFSYILQSFRSMNLILLMTVPVLTMINKSARQLLHAHLVTSTIDRKNAVAKCKPYFHQLNQRSGKSYWKFPRALISGKVVPLKRLSFPKPTKDLIDVYERMKEKFVFSLSEDFIHEFKKREFETAVKNTRKPLTKRQRQVIELLNEGLVQREIGERLGIVQSTVNSVIKGIRKKGYRAENNGNRPKLPKN